MASPLSDTHGIDRVTDKGHGTAALSNNDILPDRLEVIPDMGLDDSETNSRKDRA